MHAGCWGTTTAALAFLIKPALDDIFLNKDAVTLKWLPVAVIVIYLFKGICSWSQTVLMNFIGLRIVPTCVTVFTRAFSGNP